MDFNNIDEIKKAGFIGFKKAEYLQIGTDGHLEFNSFIKIIFTFNKKLTISTYGSRAK